MNLNFLKILTLTAGLYLLITVSSRVVPTNDELLGAPEDKIALRNTDIRRVPASINSREEAQYNSRTKDSELFRRNEPDTEAEATPIAATRSSNYSPQEIETAASFSFENFVRTPPTKQSRTQALPSETKTFIGNTEPKPPVSDATSSAQLPPPASRKPKSTDFTCRADLGAGTFEAPVTVNLSCSTAATVEYCVSDSGCCDPRGTSTTFSAPITIGQDEGTYCLSFYGTTSQGSESGLRSITYSFSAAAPNLQVSHPLRQFQTTQLPGVMHLTSSGFAKNDFQIGVINMKDHDPGPMGLNWDCDALVNGHAGLTSPVTTIPLAPLDMSTLMPNSQLDVFMDGLELQYGTNNITSYVANRSFATDAYACQSTTITLEDFAYFESSSSQAEVGTNLVREFAGAFSSYGFFEPDATVFRGPAGTTVETSGNEVLQSGLFAIFY